MYRLFYRYAKRIIAWWKRDKQTEEDVFTRWEKDFELPPLSANGLFEEYLELGTYGRNFTKSLPSKFYMPPPQFISIGTTI